MNLIRTTHFERNYAKRSRKNNFTFGYLAPVAQALVPAASR